MKVYQSIEELIGNTPLLRLNNLKKVMGFRANVFAKLEKFNPAGSVKDRASFYMIKDAEKKGLISDGAVIIEPTSGNTGIGLASICARKGYKAIFTMPDTMSMERIKLLKAYGAEVVLTDGALGMKGAIEKANAIKNNTPNSFIPSQFDNPANNLAHYETTGKEIYRDLDGNVDVFVAGIGTGATLSGVGKFLKEKNSKIKVIGVEPFSSPLITKGYASGHKIQGIGANFIPENYDAKVVDIVVDVKDEDAYDYARKLATIEGVLCGISSGASLKCAIDLAMQNEYENKNIVVLLPDAGERYLSDSLFVEV